ncbi:hypothetical protein HMPREF0204_14086 [Chryseobacterium gleum ATCC 35910]|uniref:Uncharacterized protein n=1 Tax=Chryseobacterium gleum ATCC 35910 TaxID=525257 RepID=A0ABN0APR0_CHRGE|nr:hypothetical protein HMPREF0204_14086 [Chryseobacterium gleum ATCC 35910]
MCLLYLLPTELLGEAFKILSFFLETNLYLFRINKNNKAMIFIIHSKITSYN